MEPRRPNMRDSDTAIALRDKRGVVVPVTSTWRKKRGKKGKKQRRDAPEIRGEHVDSDAGEERDAHLGDGAHDARQHEEAQGRVDELEAQAARPGQQQGQDSDGKTTRPGKRKR